MYILLQRFLLAVGRVEEKFVGRDPLVDIDPIKVVKIVRQLMHLTFLDKIRQVKVVAVKMYQMGVVPGEQEKIPKKRLFIAVALCKPLLDMPAPGMPERGADHI